MKKIIIFLFAVAVVFLAGWKLMPKRPAYLPERNLPFDQTATSTPVVSTTAWIKVEASKVTRLASATGDASGLGDISDGDLVTDGEILHTDASGSATVYFSDGSSLRLDPNTTVTITEASYNDGDSSLRARFTLTSGKVWSKITALATPESHWEVRTGTAVATVRGSAFGTEVTVAGDTSIFGSEHDVTVTPVDIETGEELADAMVIVTDKQELTIGKKHIIALKKLSVEERKAGAGNVLVRTDKAKDTKRSDWIKHNETRDQELRTEIKDLQDQGLDGKDLRDKLREQINQRKEEQGKDTNQTKEATLKGAPKIQTNTTPTPLPESTVVSIEVESLNKVLSLSEGATLQFKATATSSGGNKNDVTSRVTWRVVGSIGSIDKSGVFTAKLGDDVSELGKSFGAVTATITGSDGKELTAKSEIINVIAAPIDNLDTRG